MEIVFVRHGEPTYEYVGERGFVGHGRALSQLTQEGRRQALEAAQNPLLKDVELLVASPYPRALETAAILSRRLDLDIEVELDLREWEPDLTQTFSTDEASIQAFKLCEDNRGVCPPGSELQYEELETVFNRAKKCLLKYLPYRKIAVVSHGVLIRQFSQGKTPYCAMVPVTFTADCTWQGFIGRI